MANRILSTLVLALTAAGLGNAQSTQPVNETGALSFSVDSGVSLGVPAVRAGVAVNNAFELSPDRKVLPVVGFGTSVRAWKFLVPYADFNLIDTGKATASIGPVSSTAQADTFIFTGGLRLVGGTSRFRPYVQVGGGLFHQSVTGGFSVPGESMPLSGSGSINVISYGGGIQFHTAHKVGMTIGYDGYRFASPMVGAGQNAGAIRVGFFYQTKSSVY